MCEPYLPCQGKCSDCNKLFRYDPETSSGAQCWACESAAQDIHWHAMSLWWQGDVGEFARFCALKGLNAQEVATDAAEQEAQDENEPEF